MSKSRNPFMRTLQHNTQNPMYPKHPTHKPNNQHKKNEVSKTILTKHCLSQASVFVPLFHSCSLLLSSTG